MLALLRTFSWQELRHHPWRNAAAVLAVMLGVALAFAVHLINASALSEFSSAVRSAGGEPDLELRPVQASLDEALYAKAAAHADVAAASPILELSTFASVPGGERKPLRVVGVDALVVATIAPSLMPVPSLGADRMALFAPRQLFLNPAARQAFGDAAAVLRLQSGVQLVDAQVAGTVGAGGGALAVMDIAAVQDLFARQGQLTRIDLRLRPGTDHGRFLRSLALPGSVTATEPGDAAQRVDNLSRAYRVNLTVLALVALFTGAFLVYSVLSLSVARRAQQFALLGVLGLTSRERLGVVMVESLVLGLIGSLAGIALGTALADFGLARLGGDLGGGYFPGVAPQLHWSPGAAIVYGVLGIAAAGVGGWLPARAARGLPLAQTLKGLGSGAGGADHHLASLVTVAAGAAMAFLPPVAGIPLGAYLSIGLLLVGGITALPWAVSLLYDRLAPALAHRVLPMLAIERARRVRESAAVAVSGVVASLSLAVALTVMVASFRDSVTHWLDVVLPADLYVRTATGSASADSAWFTPELVQQVSRVEGVRRVTSQRIRPLLLDPGRPAVSLLARTIGPAAEALPLVGTLHPAPAGQVPIYVSEAMVDLYGARPGAAFEPLAKAFDGRASFFVAGVWRDYVRQSGAIAMEGADYRRLTGDARANDLQLWLAPGADAGEVQARVRELAGSAGSAAGALEFSSAQELRAVSLRIFDRSFAITYWLQAVAIVIGLFGIAASFSAQVLARRKEFGLLAHLGLTRGQVLGLVAAEGAVWTTIGSIAGLALGLAVSVVLVHVVNPQSFHWTMDLLVPWARLLGLCVAVVAAGTVTAWLAGRAAATRDAVLAVKEDW
ncbi:ABC transporter permease [Caenimonas aquaedulcis]|uniref:ABC transporter permease n=1 Tax=Caenimonas aquaedulcis TaxID=2793270 RepID=A0A931MGB6_9BURK|nr:ABC transporter permease [Caenimonas aquaedulcis]MBG9387694.1 ABC transporter permease [Caenimonas aquaedulcis]